MRILVTGGAGFIGSHTVDALLERGHSVRVLDALEPPVHASRERPEYLPSDAEALVGDVRSKEDWATALKGMNDVFLLATYQDYVRPQFASPDPGESAAQTMRMVGLLRSVL